MASIIEKIKETVVPSNNEGYNANTNSNTYNEGYNTNNNSDSYNESYNKSSHSNANSGLYNSVTENNTQQREFSSNTAQESGTQNEGVRTGDRINSLVENVPGVSSSTQKQSTFDTPSYQNDMHRDTSSHAPIDAARAPPSVLKQHLGEPSIEHDYPHESSTKRHSSVSHQEEHYNLN